MYNKTNYAKRIIYNVWRYSIYNEYTTQFSEYSREGIDLSRLEDLEAGAEVVPEQEIPDDVQEISPLVEGELFEGDAALTDEQKALLNKEGSRDSTEIEMRQALNGQKGWERYKWPRSNDGKVYVPYTFQNRNSYTRKERANIEAAFEQYSSKTCLRYEN